MNKKNETIVLGGGCFWCTEAVFENLQGVEKVTSGYAGGGTANPTYEEVSAGDTGHAEVIEVEFNPEEIKLENILEVFFAVHDPTTLNRQGNDVGTQYRSAIFWTEEKQGEIIKNYIEKIKGDFEDKIVTEVKRLNYFYEAEDYHKDYFKNNQDKPYCQIIINPKLKKAREKFGKIMK